LFKVCHVRSPLFIEIVDFVVVAWALNSVLEKRKVDVEAEKVVRN
jgi:hypothetical protein